MKNFESSPNPPQPAKNSQEDPSGDLNFHDQIQKMIEKGYSEKDIHDAIDMHTDIHSREYFKEYASAIHRPYSEYLAKIKGEGKK